MYVKDIYKKVTIEYPDIPTVKFISYLNEAQMDLSNRYVSVEAEPVSEMEDELVINPRFGTALAKYICGAYSKTADLYNKYMSEYVNHAETANNKIVRDKLKGKRIYAPRFR